LEVRRLAVPSLDVIRPLIVTTSYALQWIIALPLEIISASIVTTYWTSHLNKAVFVTIYLLAIVSINLCGIKGYGEAEFIFAIIKVVAVIGFM
jgi:yeast amino acid transporter